MSEFFDARLSEYEEHPLTRIDPARQFHPLTANCLPQGHGTRLLGLGCGTGLEIGYC
jgi:tRNA (cmo5U34)-methyltransferase